jgi:hypothetical protein
MYWFKKTKMTNQYAFDHVDLDKTGICWGYKMYTMLGFPSNMYDPKSYPGPDDTLEGRFDHYKAFFEYCVDKEIPITCHGSPAAMTIADTILYLKEHEKEHPESGEFKDQLYSHIPEEIKESLQFVDDSFVRPGSWRKVLDTPGLKTLKLNLAHSALFKIRFGTVEQPTPRSSEIPPPRPLRKPLNTVVHAMWQTKPHHSAPTATSNPRQGFDGREMETLYRLQPPISGRPPCPECKARCSGAASSGARITSLSPALR